MKISKIVALKFFASAVVIAAMAGCHSTPKRATAHVSVPPHHSVSPNDGIWTPDQFSAYSVGRYVDPSDPAVMHDAHTLYRREETGRWNLAPPQSQMPPASSVRAASQPDSVLLRDALTAELSRQRAASLALVQQAGALNAHLRELNAQSLEFHDALKQFYLLRDQMTAVSNRLDSLEYQLNRLPPTAKSP